MTVSTNDSDDADGDEDVADVGEREGANLLGEPEPAGSTRRKSAKGYRHYAAVIGVSERTIKRWVSVGKKARAHFPLDDLTQALAWWSRHMRNSPPAELVAAAAKSTPAAAPCSAAAPAATQPATTSQGKTTGKSPAASKPPTDAPPAVPFFRAGEMSTISLEENLRRVSLLHNANLDLLERAFLGSNEAEVMSRQRNAKLSGDMLGAAQRAFDDYQRARGDMASIPDLKSDLFRVHTAMAQSLVTHFIAVGATRDRAVAEADIWFRQLRESKFFSDTLPELTAPPTSPPSAQQAA